LSCDIEVLERRYVDRISARHPAHRGVEAVPDLRERVATGAYGIPELGCPVLRVDTTAGFDPAETTIVDWLGETANKS
jgi:hypothetical protein